MKDKEKRTIIIYEILVPSLQRLYEMDFDNIRIGVSERNICARLAHHMENIMRESDKKSLFVNYYADVEYNRMSNGDLKHFENSKHLPQYMISDLLIQSRGELRNLLAVEMKRKGNNRHIDKDKERLEALTSYKSNNPDLHCVFGTLVGAFIIYSIDSVKVEVFEDVNDCGKNTGRIEFECITDGIRYHKLRITKDTYNHQ